MDTSTIEYQYKEAKKFSFWIKESLSLINSGKHPTQYANLTEKSWYMIICNYMIDTHNFPTELNDIYVGIIKFTSAKTGIPPLEVKLLLEESEDTILKRKFFSKAEIVSTIEEKYEGKYEIKIGNIVLDLPYYIVKMVDRKDFSNVPENIVKLVLRYFMFNTSLGYFWSVDPEVYEEFTKLGDSSLEPLECFASPINYNAKQFCSMFSEDKKLPYPKGYKCVGNFFSTIKTIKGPRKFLFNPPYTDRMIDRSVAKLIEYMNQNEGCEFIALMPDWIKTSKAIRSLCEYPNSYYKILEPETYYIFDFSLMQRINPKGLSLTLIVNSGISVEESKKMYERCMEKMSVN